MVTGLVTESYPRADIMTAYANLSGEINPTVPTRVIFR